MKYLKNLLSEPDQAPLSMQITDARMHHAIGKSEKIGKK